MSEAEPAVPPADTAEPTATHSTSALSDSNGHPASTTPPHDPVPSSDSASSVAAAEPAAPEARRVRKPSMILITPSHTPPTFSSSPPDGSPALAPFPTSSSFSTFPTSHSTLPTTSTSSPPQSPQPQPLSPNPLPSPPPPPSRPASHRLVDYFLVIGRQPPSQQSLVPMRRLSRSNSQTIQPISDLSISTSKDSATDPSSQDWTKLTDFEREDVNLNPGFMRTPVYITESRVPKRSQAPGAGVGGAAALVHPITGVDVIYLDKKEGPKPGYVQLPGSLSRGSFKGSVALCVERDVKKSPIIDMKIVQLNSRDSKDKAAADKDKDKGGADKTDKEKTAAGESAAVVDSCPPDYVLIDKVLTSHKGKDYCLCYKVAVRRAVEYMAYEAFVLDRYPPTDHADQPLEAQGVAMLAFPRGMILSADMSMPSFMTFVITQADGSEMYGAALIFYERVTDLTDMPALYPLPGGAKSGNGLLSPPRPRGAGDEQQVWCPKCLCLLSHHPYYDVYKVFLNQLYRIAVSPSSLPIERYIANFFYDVPVPTLLYPIVRFTMGHEKLSIRMQLKLGLPHQHVSLMPLFKCLSLPNIIAVFQHVLAEGKLVLVSSSYTLLTPVAEAIRALLYPFKWQCVFIPILPTNLAYTIRAPVPFIVGLHRSFMDEIRVPAEVMQVDLDRNRVTPPAPDPDAEKQITPLPPSLREQLEAHLNSFVDVYRPPDEHSNTELDSYTAPLESTDAELATFQELNIRLTFMRVIIRFLGEYRRFCILREEDEEDEVFDLDRLFDRKSFLASFPPGLVDFARQMTDTQGFSDFVLNRVSHTSRMEELLFFDYCAALTREDPAGKKKDPNGSAGGSATLTLPEQSAKPMLARSNTSAGLETDKKRFSRSGNRTLTDLVQPIDLYRTGSLTIEKIEEFAALHPSITPFRYTPGQEKPYIAPGPDESDCPPSLNYQSFPTLDLERFPASARALLAEQQAFAAYSVLLEKRKSAAKKAAKAAAKAEMGRGPQTPGKHTAGSSASSSSTPIASPIKNRGNLSLDHIPSSPKSSQGSFAFTIATAQLTSTSLQKIVLALYTLLNSLTARTAKGSADELKASHHAASIYEMWFSLFVSECEKERARRVDAQEASRFSKTTDNIEDPLTAVRDTREDAFSPVASEVHNLPAAELPVTVSDLLSIYTELHTMVYKGSILPDEVVLQDISLFCLRAGLTREFQELYRLLSTSVPCPGVDFFVTLAKVGVSVLPGNPCSPALLAEKWKLAKEAGGKEFDFPTSLETTCTCPKCGYQLSGEEIMAGWVLADRLQSTCPLCETAAQPQLIVTHAERPSMKFDFLKASHLRSTIHSMTALDAHAKDPMGGESGEVTDLGDSGSIDLFASTSGAAAVTSHDYLRTIKQHEFLFWNSLWYFTSRGLHADEYGQLPFHFLFGEAANSPTWEQPRYVFSAKPYKAWRVYQEGSASVEEEDQRGSVSGSMSTQPSRSVSPSPFSANQSLLSETLSRSFPNDEESSATSTQPSSTQASPQINGHRGSETNGGDELNLTAGSSVSLTSSPIESELPDGGDDDGGANEGVMSPLSLTARALSLNLNAEAKEADTAGSTAAGAAAAGKGVSPMSDAAGAPLMSSMSSSSMASRRDVRTWQGVVSIMRAPQATGKQKAVPRAVHEILRARKARRAWSKEQKESDPDSASFSASMYRQLSLLLQDPTDPIGFAAEYRGAISSLNQLIETHKKAVETLDAKVAQLYRNATTTTTQSPSSTTPSTTASPGPPVVLRSPSNAAAAAASLEPSAGPPSIARSPSQSTPLSSLLSPSSSSGPSFPTNVVLDSDSQASVDANRKKRAQLIATLQEAISLRSEMTQLDSPPIEKIVTLLPTIRRLFAHDPTASQKKAAPTTAAGAAVGSPDAHHTAYASLVEDVLLNEVPALEDVLSQSSQNPYYTLEGFNKFCARFLTKEEKEAERWKALQAAAAATSTSAPPSPAPGGGKVSKPAPSLAYKYATFWQTARKWKVGYEKNEKQRSISMQMKKDQQEMIQDVLYETAKALYQEYLEPQPAAAPPAPAATTNATATTTTAPAETAALPAAAAGADERKEKTEGAPEPGAAAAAPVLPKAKAPLRPVTTVAGFVIDGPAFAALKAALGDVHSSATPSNKPSTPTSSSTSAASPTGPTTPTSSSSTSASSSKASIASTLSKRRVPKTLFDDVLGIAQRWLQDTVLDEWVEEVKETEHSITPLSSLGLTGLHQHNATTPSAQQANSGVSRMQGQGSAGPGKPPFSKTGSTPVMMMSKGSAVSKSTLSLGGAGKK